MRDLDPALGFQTHHVAELLRRHGVGFGALIVEKLGELRRGQHFADLALSALTTSAGMPAGPTMPHQDHRSKPAIPASSRVGTSGRQRRSPGARHRKRPCLAAPGKLQHLRKARDVDVDMAADEIVERRRAALVGNVRELHARRQRDQFGRNLIDAAETCRGVGDLAGLAPGEREHVAGGFHGELVRCDEQQRRAGDEGDRHEVPARVERHGLLDRRVDRECR